MRNRPYVKEYNQELAIALIRKDTIDGRTTSCKALEEFCENPISKGKPFLTANPLKSRDKRYFKFPRPFSNRAVNQRTGKPRHL